MRHQGKQQFRMNCGIVCIGVGWFGLMNCCGLWALQRQCSATMKANSTPNQQGRNENKQSSLFFQFSCNQPNVFGCFALLNEEKEEFVWMERPFPLCGMLFALLLFSLCWAAEVHSSLMKETSNPTIQFLFSLNQQRKKRGVDGLIKERESCCPSLLLLLWVMSRRLLCRTPTSLQQSFKLLSFRAVWPHFFSWRERRAVVAEGKK